MKSSTFPQQQNGNADRNALRNTCRVSTL